MRETVESMEKVVNDTEKMIWREEGQKYLYQSKRVLILIYNNLILIILHYLLIIIANFC